MCILQNDALLYRKVINCLILTAKNFKLVLDVATEYLPQIDYDGRNFVLEQFLHENLVHI